MPLPHLVFLFFMNRREEVANAKQAELAQREKMIKARESDLASRDSGAG